MVTKEEEDDRKNGESSRGKFSSEDKNRWEKVRKPNIQIAEVKEKTESRGKKIITEIIQEDSLELKDISYQKGPASAQCNINRTSW